MKEEKRIVLELLRKLDFKRTIEFCYMVKGAVFTYKNDQKQA